MLNYTKEERIFMATEYIRSHSFVHVQRAFSLRFTRRDHPSGVLGMEDMLIFNFVVRCKGLVKENN